MSLVGLQVFPMTGAVVVASHPHVCKDVRGHNRDSSLTLHPTHRALFSFSFPHFDSLILLRGSRAQIRWNLFPLILTKERL